MTGAAFRARVDAICALLPGAQRASPEDGALDSWKIGGKMFVCFGDDSPGVSVKCTDAETAAMLIDAGIGTKARYFNRSWLRLTEELAGAELTHRLHSSYDLIRSSLTRKAQAGFAPREG